MSLYLHKFSGFVPSGESYSYGWKAQSIRTLTAAHSAAIAWNDTLWDGATAGNGLEDHLTIDTSLTSVVTVQLDELNLHQLAKQESAVARSGVAAGNPLPSDVAFAVSLRTALPRVRGRGRFYLPAAAASNLTADGRIASDLINDVSAALAAAWGAYNTGTDFPVVYSSVDKLSRRVTFFNIGDEWDTQRRRENKRAEVRVVTTMP